MMITQETKEMIEKEARLWSRTVMGVELSDVYEDPREVDAYIAGATKYAEKVESLKSQIGELNVAIKTKNEKLNNQYDGLNHLKAQLESKEVKLSRLKVIAGDLFNVLQEAADKQLGDVNWNKGNQALTAYAEWSKQNLK